MQSDDVLNRLASVTYSSRYSDRINKFVFEVDFTAITFDDFISFVFDHPLRAAPDVEPHWHMQWDDGRLIKITFDMIRQASLLTRLFQAPEFLLERFAPDQLEQGFWLLIGSERDGFCHDLLWDEGIPWPTRRGLIASMGDLYERLFALQPLPLASHMWWDALAYGYRFNPDGSRQEHVPETDANDRMVQQAMFETLVRILAIESVPCQLAALHGLGHLNHADGREAIEAYLRSHPRLDADTKAYALACIDDKIL